MFQVSDVCAIGFVMANTKIHPCLRFPQRTETNSPNENSFGELFNLFLQQAGCLPRSVRVCEIKCRTRQRGHCRKIATYAQRTDTNVVNMTNAARRISCKNHKHVVDYLVINCRSSLLKRAEAMSGDPLLIFQKIFFTFLSCFFCALMIEFRMRENPSESR